MKQWESELQPEWAVDEAVSFLVRRGWRIDSRLPASAGLSMQPVADPAGAFFLSLLFLLPGLVYMLCQRRMKAIAIISRPRQAGCLIVMTASDPDAERDCAEFVSWAESPATPRNEEDAAVEILDRMRTGGVRHHRERPE